MSSDKDYVGLLCIGDPHLASRVPGFRKDDYPKSILGKLTRSLKYAYENHLLPILLGDVFHRPRDNANWLLVRLMEILEGEVLAIAGNHDCSESVLTEHDSLAILCAAKKIRLLGNGRWGTEPWRGFMNGVPVAIGGTHWKQELPDKVDRSRLHVGERGFVFWVVHDDIRFPGWEGVGKLNCYEIPGVDYVINGHIHKKMPEIRAGTTTWLNPGNIARLERSDDCRQHKPAALRIDIVADGSPKTQPVEVLHESFEAVFHEKLDSNDDEVALDDSIFVKGLEELQRIKTTGGEGAELFLNKNKGQFPESVAKEISRLYEEVKRSHDSTGERDNGF